MCGLFGLIRNPAAEHPEWATAVLAELGYKATTRGRHSAGLAYIPVDANSSITPTKYSHVEARITQVGGGVVINKDAKVFKEVWRDERDIELAQSSIAVIGHTRTATQGSTTDRKNVSPLAVGTVIGTHNGDIDDTTVEPWLPKDSLNYGATDTETLLRAISEVRSHRRKITDILTATRGRVAMAWYDRRLPGRLYIARGGMAPISIAFDSEDNLYWATNPQWFRDIDKMFDGAIGFHSIMLVPEGRLMTITYGKHEVPYVDDIREFVPTVRKSDERLPDGILWRDFVDADMKADKSAFIHKVYNDYKKFESSSVKQLTSGKSSYKKPYTVRQPHEYDWDTLGKYTGSSFDFGHADVYDDANTDSFGIDWLEPDYPGSGGELDSVDALEECSTEEGAEAVSEAGLYLEHEKNGQVGGPYVRQALFDATQKGNYDGIVQDFRLSNAKVARAFAELVLSQNP